MLQQTQVTRSSRTTSASWRASRPWRILRSQRRTKCSPCWTGLGYYARLHLHAAGRAVVAEFGGAFPRTVEDLESLKGIGRSTAGAIASMAFDVRAPILDGNVKRVLARLRDQSPDRRARSREAYVGVADALTPNERVADYTQAIMDLGATLCARG